MDLVTKTLESSPYFHREKHWLTTSLGAPENSQVSILFVIGCVFSGSNFLAVVGLIYLVTVVPVCLAMCLERIANADLLASEKRLIEELEKISFRAFLLTGEPEWD